MKIIAVLPLLYLFFFCGSTPNTAQAVCTVAVPKVVNRSGFDHSLGAFTDELIAAFIEKTGNRVAERANFDTLFGEIELSQVGAISSQNVLKAGKLAGADHLLFTTITGYSTSRKAEVDNQFFYHAEIEMRLSLSARLVHIESGTITGAGRVDQVETKILDEVHFLNLFPVNKGAEIRKIKAELSDRVRRQAISNLVIQLNKCKKMLPPGLKS